MGSDTLPVLYVSLCYGREGRSRFISVVTIEGRKIVQWRDYMDSLTAMTALSDSG